MQEPNPNTEREVIEILRELFPTLSDSDRRAVESDLESILADVYQQYVILKETVERKLTKSDSVIP